MNSNGDELLLHMRDVIRCEASLRELNLVWRVIEMNARMNCPEESERLLPMMAATRSGFEELQSELIESLVEQKIAGVTTELRTMAQHIIDIIVRNLFERTADVGFLATDRTLCEYLAGSAHDREAVTRRLRAYRSNYTVYDEVMLVDLQGKVVANIQDESTEGRRDDALLAETLEADSFVETFRLTGLRPGQRPSLIYSQRMVHPDNQQPVGMLCLVFGFDNEMEGIFSAREDDESRSISVILDKHHRVIATSDEGWIAHGTQLKPLRLQESPLCWIAGCEYMAQSASSAGYQGYPGPPGWEARVMVPVSLAFSPRANPVRRAAEPYAPGLLTHANLFCPPLRPIVDAATTIRRVVWNGQVMTADESSGGRALSTVLEQITEAGASSDEVFKRSIDDLFDASLTSQCSSAESLTQLLVELLDRNLYERSNDCRWWAMTPELRATLAMPAPGASDFAALNPILEYINGLYTVYTRLVVYNRNGLIVSASNPLLADGTSVVGLSIDGDSLAAVKALRTSEHYYATPFVPSPFYDDRSTYVYHAAIRALGNESEIVGGIGIVFDSEPQLFAMLDGCLGDAPSGCIALFVDRNGKVMSSTTPAHAVASQFALPTDFLGVPMSQSKSRVMVRDTRYVAIAAAASPGYREFKITDGYSDDVVAVFLQPLGETVETGHRQLTPITETHAGAGAHGFATFLTDVGLFALPVSCLVEALPGRDVRPVSLGASEYRVGAIARRRDAAVQGYVWVYDLNALLGGRSLSRSESSEVLIIRHNDVEIGFVVSNLHAVPAFDERQLTPAMPFGSSRNALVSHLIRANSGELLIQLLDAQRLVDCISSTGDADWEPPLESLAVRAAVTADPVRVD